MCMLDPKTIHTYLTPNNTKVLFTLYTRQVYELLYIQITSTIEYILFPGQNIIGKFIQLKTPKTCLKDYVHMEVVAAVCSQNLPITNYARIHIFDPQGMQLYSMHLICLHCKPRTDLKHHWVWTELFEGICVMNLLLSRA